MENVLRLLDWLKSLRVNNSKPRPDPTPEQRATFNFNLIQLHNKERTKRGIAPLRPNGLLALVALNQAEFCAAKNTQTHFGPNGENIGQRVNGVGYNFTFCGENIAYRPGGQVEDPNLISWAMTEWLNSPDHLANIMSPNFTEVGGNWADNAGVRYIAVVFGTSWN